MTIGKWIDYYIIKKSGYFDPAYYLLNNPDVRLADINPLWQFIEHGWKEGRNPSLKFDTQFYLSSNPDVEKAGINPLVHYLKFGLKEGRKPSKNEIETLEEKIRSLTFCNVVYTIFKPLFEKLRSWERLKLSLRITNKVSKKVSIIIPNYNGRKYLEDCLKSLDCIDFPKDQFEIIVVDNASSDGSRGFISSNYPNVILVESPKNLGFSGGCNLGIKSSNGEYIVLLNNDTVVDRNWLKELVIVADSSKDIVIVGSKILFKNDPALIQNAGSYLTDWGDGGDIGFRQIDEGQYDTTREVMAVCGASMLIKRELIEEIGAFDEDFESYYEDTDLCYRARLNGKKIVFVPKSIVYHIHSGTSNEWSPYFTFHVLRNKLFIHLKNAPFIHFLKVLFFYLIQVVRESIIGQNRKIHLHVLVSFMIFLPKMIMKRIIVRCVIKDVSDRMVILRFTKAKRKIRDDSIRSICIYNAYLPTMGGGENQISSVVEFLNNLFPEANIDILCHPTDTYTVNDFRGIDFLQKLHDNFDVDIKKTRIRFEPIYVPQPVNMYKRLFWLLALFRLSKITKKYDLFINNTFASSLPASAKINIYYCMFPTPIWDGKGWRLYFKSKFYYKLLKSYHLFLANSHYTQEWIDRYWGVNSYVLYPPIGSKKSLCTAKENIIVSIGRFFIGGHNKKQDVMVQSFIDMYHKGWAKDWKLILIGRKHTDPPSEEYIQNLERIAEGYPIEFIFDAQQYILLELLCRAKMYWHATGFGEDLTKDPVKFEHFGLSTLEAMQYGCVPVVYKAGGQPEIVKHGENGFLWNSTEELITFSELLIKSEFLWRDMSKTARESTNRFRKETIYKQFAKLLSLYYEL